MGSFLYKDIDEWAEAYIRVHEAEASLVENHPDYLAAYEFIQDLKGPLAETCWHLISKMTQPPERREVGAARSELQRGPGAEGWCAGRTGG